jgi:hypothetical protein
MPGAVDSGRAQQKDMLMNGQSGDARIRERIAALILLASIVGISLASVVAIVMAGPDDRSEMRGWYSLRYSRCLGRGLAPSWPSTSHVRTCRRRPIARFAWPAASSPVHPSPR